MKKRVVCLNSQTSEQDLKMLLGEINRTLERLLKLEEMLL